MAAFVGDGRRLPVAGEHDRLWRQGVEMGANPGGEVAEVTVWEVGSSDSFSKQHVATKYERG